MLHKIPRQGDVKLQSLRFAVKMWKRRLCRLFLSRRHLAAVKPDEAPLTGSGCVKDCVSGQTGKFAQSQNTPRFGERGSAFAQGCGGQGGNKNIPKPTFFSSSWFPSPCVGTKRSGKHQSSVICCLARMLRISCLTSSGVTAVMHLWSPGQS